MKKNWNKEKTTIYTICCFKNVDVPGTPRLNYIIIDVLIFASIFMYVCMYEIFFVIKKNI
jgi:hypothetical protein